MNLTNTLITERLSITLVTADDFEFIFRLLNSKDWIANIGDRNIDSMDAAKRYIQTILARENFNYFVVRITASGIPVGIISFIKRDYLLHFDIGFALLPEFYGCGYAMEAATRVLEECKRAGHQTILATALPSNESSIRLLTKLGFTHERDMMNNDVSVKLFKWSASDALVDFPKSGIIKP
jgi:[ribosomal protein S5]-alanine N-acetyltransferase